MYEPISMAESVGLKKKALISYQHWPHSPYQLLALNKGAYIECQHRPQCCAADWSKVCSLHMPHCYNKPWVSQLCVRAAWAGAALTAPRQCVGQVSGCVCTTVYGQWLLDSDEVGHRQLASQQALLHAAGRHTGQRGITSHIHTALCLSCLLIFTQKLFGFKQLSLKCV